ncbi:hypothetical protein U0026_16735 [Kluyvera intermedia]|uniref:hypothetical protein n=1 Tax=Kluyvera intermedia TaxID=61648 RepID=UPI000786ECD9|nr:hypothetical protein [Kluyvera intermedia]WQD28661.1 hypothetical protein U0026_16735 [Kluyvera intermedia]VDZ84344.1 Uncharacterised protein [Kluyvera intermedia]
MTTNQTVPVTDEELDQMIWKLERDGMTPKQLSLMRELRELRMAKGEPVAWIVHARTGDQLTTDSGYVANAEGILGLHSTPLYAAPPAPPAYKKTENFTDYHAGWNTCRAAMLQSDGTLTNEDAMLQLSGNSEQLEPVSNRDELPFEQWLSQQEGSIDVDCGCVMTEVLFHWMRVAYEAGNCRKNEDSSTRYFREISETSTNCPKCGGRGTYHCPQMLGTVECECTLPAAPKEVG